MKAGEELRREGAKGINLLVNNSPPSYISSNSSLSVSLSLSLSLSLPLCNSKQRRNPTPTHAHQPIRSLPSKLVHPVHPPQLHRLAGMHLIAVSRVRSMKVWARHGGRSGGVNKQACPEAINSRALLKIDIAFNGVRCV